MDRHYSYVNEDDAYLTMYQNKVIDGLLPYVPDVEHRLVQFLRTLYYYKTNAITPCIPLYMEYGIKKRDWDEISRYIKRYNIKAFNKNKKN